MYLLHERSRLDFHYIVSGSGIEEPAVPFA